MTCDVVACEATETRRYLNGDYCPQHTPAAAAGRPEPPQGDGSGVTGWQTLAGAKGGTDINKERPGGYMSRQRAVKIAATADAVRAMKETA